MWYHSSCFEDPSNWYIQTAFSCQLRVWSSPLYLLSFPPRCTGSHELWTCKADTGMTKALRSLNRTFSQWFMTTWWSSNWLFTYFLWPCVWSHRWPFWRVWRKTGRCHDPQKANCQKENNTNIQCCVAGRTLTFLVIIHSKSQKNYI